MMIRKPFLASAAALAFPLVLATVCQAQNAPSPAPTEMTAEQDHQKMMDLLNIKSLRRGADGDPKSANAANADESKVGTYTLPDPLVTKNGKKVTTPAQWANTRRPEIVEDFDREVYGRVPANTPDVKWEVVSTTREMNGGVPVIIKKLVGHVDNSAYPQVSVNMDLTLTTPANAPGPVPVMMEFGFVFPAGLRPPPRPAASPNAPPEPTWQQQVLAKGWGYAIFVPTTVQADNGAGLTKGIIGLVNKGQSRKPDDWGALRAWAWGASRALDYLETDKTVDAKHVGIEGLSRYGKAAIVTMAYDPRFAIGFIGSSGEGGVKIHRRNFGEMVENVASSGEYHWMAGNFLKYAGPLTPRDLPVDAHELVALCAPRPVFISTGSPQVEGNWVDDKGMFLGGVGAGPVYQLLGKKGLGTSEMPPQETALIDGDVAFRQHAGGHTTGPNWPTFLTWASRYIKPMLLPSISSISAAAVAPQAAPLMVTVTPDKPSGVYQIGDTVHWTVERSGGEAAALPASAHYALKSGGATVIKSGDVMFQNNRATFDYSFTAPGTVLAEITWAGDKPGRAVGGAVAGWDKISPAAPAPQDFDAFWAEQIKGLKKIAPNAQLTSAESGKPNVSYWKITLDNINNTHVQGQIARPEKGDKFPAILIPQWAGVYGLQKGWATDRAAAGWLALNIEAHDILIDQPEPFYQNLSNGPLKNYWNIGNDDRSASYFLRMYLGCYQALEYLKTRPDWDGKTLVVMGTSQGGQQTLAIAGLHPEDITAALALVPSGSDMLAPQAGRAAAFPNWYFNLQKPLIQRDGETLQDASANWQREWQKDPRKMQKDPDKVHETSRYFDVANFAARIKCPVLVGLGLRDETCPPSTVLSAVNKIPTLKEVLILPLSGHQDENGSQASFSQRAYGAWLPALKQNKPVPAAKLPAP